MGIGGVFSNKSGYGVKLLLMKMLKHFAKILRKECAQQFRGCK